MTGTSFNPASESRGKQRKGKTFAQVPFSNQANGLIAKLLSTMLAVLMAFCMMPLVPSSAFAEEGQDATVDSAPADEIVVENDELEVVENELVVVYENDALEVTELNESTSADVEIVEKEPIEGAVSESETIDVVTISDDTDLDAAIEELAQNPNVAYVEPNYIFTKMEASQETMEAAIETAEEQADGIALQATKTDDAMASDQYYLQSSRFQEAWDSVKCNGAVTVAVIDDGCMYTHPDLKANINTYYAYDAVRKQSLRSTLATTGKNTSHGTNVAGVIAAVANNGSCTVGASYNAKVLPINVFTSNGKAAYSTIMEALNYIEGLARSNRVPNMRVLNMSFGAYDENEIAIAMRNSLQRLRDKYNILPIAAGGNGDLSQRPILSKSFPADYDVCVSVTSLNASGANSTWCDYNEYKDISAPGENILTTSNNGNVAYVSGTSFSAPLVSSAAALVCAARPGLTATQVENVLKQTATKVTGNACPQSGSKGALNVKAAVDLALSGKAISNTPMARYTTMFRMYNPNSGEHFYTGNAGERDNLMRVGWRYEGTGWNVPIAGNPVYRLYNANAGDHHYTPSASERDMLVRAGWSYEGIGWNTSVAESKPLYRLYNPNAVAGSHHYTLSLNEANNLTSLGWQYEGIGWYGTE